METLESPAKSLRRDAAANRQRLLDAASQVFAERGLEASVDEVARVAGVGMGTLYRRFPTKDALIGELVRELLVEVVALGRDALSVPDGGGLEQFLWGTGAAQTTHRGCLARMWNDPQTYAIKRESRGITTELLRSAQEHGKIRSDATLGDIDLLFWSLRGVIEETKSLDAPVWRRHLEIVIAGLRPSAQPLHERPMSPPESERIWEPETER